MSYPHNVKDIQTFLGFDNFYRRFIDGFSRICRPLPENLRQGVQFSWTEACEELFKDQNEDSSLHQFSPISAQTSKPKSTKTIAISSKARYCPISTPKTRNGTRVAFYFKKLSPAKWNHDIQDNELGGIVAAFQGWRYLLRCCKDFITVYTDHQDLTYFNTKWVVKPRQAK